MKLITYFRLKLGALTFVSDLVTDYMRRRMIWSPWRTVRLHKIMSSDAGRDLHDHPWDFTSLILTHGYYEHLPSGFYQQRVWRPPLTIVRHKANDLHRIEIYKEPVYTLVFTGPVRRDWGFQTPNKWLSYEDYDGVSMPEREKDGVDESS